MNPDLAKMAAAAQTDDQSPSERANGDQVIEDPTARTRIREAALSHFARDGYDQATIRAIAHTAGVSHGMLRHHFGSKVALRAACDNYVLERLRRLNTLILTAPKVAGRAPRTSRQLWLYAARSLADGSPTAGPIFDEMVTLTERWLMMTDDLPSDQPPTLGRSRAALLAAMAIGIPLVHEHLTRAAGVDVFAPEGEHLVGHALLRVDALDLLRNNAEAAAPT
jgi:TetR/AcrR family transcriptional regulator, regulator of cefoperazone and chloramphenicol sensitivity